MLVKLLDHVDIISGFAFKSSFFNTEGQGIPIVRIRDVNKGESDTFYSGEYDDRYLVNDGDYVIGMDGEFNLNKWRGGQALLNQRVCKIADTSKELDKSFAAWFLKQELKRIEAKTPFVTVKHLSMKMLSEIEIPLRSLEQQSRVTTLLNNAEEALQKIQDVLLDLDRLQRSVFLEMFGDPHFNSQSWRKLTFGEALSEGIFVEIKDGNHGERHPKARDFSPEGVPFITANCFDKSGLNLQLANKLDPIWLKKLRTGFARRGDVLLTHKGTVGASGILDSLDENVILSPQVTYYRLSHDLDAEYFAGYLGTQALQRLIRREAAQSTRLYIGITRQLTLPLLIPPIALQQKYKSACKQIRSIREALLEQLSEADMLFASIQHQLFQGKS